MPLHHYIDNEVPDFAEWDTVVADGGATVVQTAESGFPERGKLGLRIDCQMEQAWVEKQLGGAGDHLAIGFWMRIVEPPDWAWWMTKLGVCEACAEDDAGMRLHLRQHPNGLCLSLHQATDGSLNVINDDLLLDSQRWHYLVAVCHWGQSECEAKLYIDGSLRGHSVLADCGAGRRPDRVRLGCTESGGVCPVVLDFDEIKIADAYPEPFRAEPQTEHPAPERTVVLVADTEYGREFADGCVEMLGIPRGNRCVLSNASTDETLQDHAAFEQQVENDLRAWLATNPTAAARCNCLLLGGDLPGYFMHDGLRHSATSRLMNTHQPFSTGSDNPLYAPGEVTRLTKAALDGLYLVTRIDAPDPQDARTVMSRSVSVSAMESLPADNLLYCDDAAYRPSPACGRLRMPTSDISKLDMAAMVWGRVADPQFGDGGTRAVFADTSAGSAATLRDKSLSCGRALFDAGFAAALGCSDEPDDFDVESFFEMLRIGGTLAEAFAVATARLDYTSVACGVPTMTVATPRAGVNIYHGVGSADAIDYSAPMAYLHENQQTVDVPLELAAGRRHYLAARAVSSASVEENNTHIITCARADAQGVMLGEPLPTPTDLVVDVLSPGRVAIGFVCRVEPGLARPEAFEVLSDNGSGQLDADNPVASIPAADDREVFMAQATDLTLPAKLAVRCRRDGHTGELSQTVNAAWPTPAPPAVL